MDTQSDNLLDLFEAELKSGDAPSIESYLNRCQEQSRPRILRELISLEIYYRIKQGRLVSLSDYERLGSDAFLHAEEAWERNNSYLRKADDSQSPTDRESADKASDLAGKLIGRYLLLGKLGEGGMGAVWLAEQQVPVKRQVALKLIKGALASKEVIARFEAERQALALMNHQNIAKVLDAGTTEDDRPFFVMELVDGVPITEYCDENKLSVDERLKLFLPVCKAVQHAHQKGILHRDIKPTNVLVTANDEVAIPKVIDFGLAKATEHAQKLTDKTMMTQFGAVVGTLQYMSPEQAELGGLDAHDVDTRTDVYSLGVMLYELLTGSTPLDKETLSHSALFRALHIIREQDPPRPSNRLSSSSNEVASEVSDQRGLPPARLQQILKGDLDWVVMKALEKDRSRRYQTANDFAQDITNYLTGAAVAARPPSTWYQVQKFAGRHRGLVAAALAIGVVLLAGIAGTSYGLIRANQKTKLAEDKTREAEVERAKTKASEQQALMERDKAQSNEKRAIEAEHLASVETRRARDSEAIAKFQLANARWDAKRPADARDLLREIPMEYRDNFEWNFCNRQFDGSDFTCYGHTDWVFDVVFSPDGTRIATASYDSSVKIWDAGTGQELNKLIGHRGPIDLVVFSTDGTRLATAYNAHIKIWDAKSGKAIESLEGHGDNVVGLAFGPNDEQLVSVSVGATVKRWDVRTGREVSTLRLEHDQEVLVVAFSPGGERLVTGADSVVTLWDTATGRAIAQRNDVSGTRSVAIGPNGQHIAAAGHDIVWLWDGELNHLLWTAEEKSGWIYDLNFSPDGTRIASTGEKDRQVRVREVHTGEEVAAFVGHGSQVNRVAFNPSGTRLASTSGDRTLKLWDARTGRKPTSIQAHDNFVFGLAFNSDGTRLASVSGDRTFKLWDVTTGLEIASLQGFYNHWSPGAHCVAFSPDDAYVAFGCNDHSVTLVDGQTGAELRSLQGHGSYVCTVAIAPDSKHLASGSNDQTVKLWDIESGEEIATLEGHSDRVNGVAFSPDGALVASASDDRTIKLWDVQSGAEIKSFDGHRYNVSDVVFSPNGKQIASSSDDHTIRIWDLQSGKQLTELSGHTAGVCGSVFSPDGSRIASTSFDRALKLWDRGTGQEIATIERNAIKGVAFSPDGRRIAVGADDGSIRFHDAPTQHEVHKLKGHSAPVTQWSFNDDGSKLYSASKNEKLVWDLATKNRDADAEWNPPVWHERVAPNGRWLVECEENDLILVDLEYKNTPQEKAYRSAKSRFDSAWHHEQATVGSRAKNWYSAAFHFALLMKNDPDQELYRTGLQTSFQKLETQFKEDELQLAMVVQESLQLLLGHKTAAGDGDGPSIQDAGIQNEPRLPATAELPNAIAAEKLPPHGNEVDNSSFEEPKIRRGSFGFRNAIPGWNTTSESFEIWSTGFQGVESHTGKQFVELNANEDGTLYKDATDIETGAVLEFSFAHRGRNGEDTMKFTIVDLGPDNLAGGGDDKELFAKEYTTGTNAWSIYDSTTEPKMLALGNKIRFAFSAVYATGGQGPDKTEGNFLDTAEFGVGVVSGK